MLDKALAVAAAKAKLTGLVIAAAAVGGTAVAAGSTAFVPTSGEDTVSTTATPEATEDTTADPTVAPTTDPTEGAAPAATDAPAPAAALPLPCPTDVANHGAYVSQVAHDDSLKGREHGKAVSEAAKSDCGKPADDATEATDAETADAPDAEQEDAEQEDADQDDADSSDTPKAHKHGKKHHRQ